MLISTHSKSPGSNISFITSNIQIIKLVYLFLWFYYTPSFLSVKETPLLTIKQKPIIIPKYIINLIGFSIDFIYTSDI